MRLQLVDVARQHGSHVVLDAVGLQIDPGTRLGLVGRNGSGKSTLLRILAGLEQPDTGTVVREPRTLTAGYLPQEHDRPTGETVLGLLARRTGVAAAEGELGAAADALASGDDAGARYTAALDRFLALGGGDLEPRAAGVLAELGLPVALDREVDRLSGGEAARLALAAILLSRYDVLLLDEPTNDLDFDGLERLERFVATTESALVVVSHDRAFLDRTVTRIAEIEDGRGRVREFAGGWTEYAAARDAARAGQYERFSEAQERRQELSSLLSERRNQARAGGGMADRRGTHALMTKVRQAERLLDRNELPEKPFEPWQLQLGLRAGTRSGSLVARLAGAVATRGGFTLGPIDLDLVPGERLAVTGRNGSGKSTLLAALLGELPLERGAAGARAHDGGRHDRAGARPARRHACCSTRSSRAPSSPPSTRGRCSPSSGSARITSGAPGRRCRRASERERTLPSCRHAASTSCSSTSPRTTSTSRPSSSSSRPSARTTARSWSSATTEASWKRSSRRGSSPWDEVNDGATTGEARLAPTADSGTLGGRSWQSPSERPRKPAATSVGPSMASR